MDSGCLWELQAGEAPEQAADRAFRRRSHTEEMFFPRKRCTHAGTQAAGSRNTVLLWYSPPSDV